MEIRRIRLDEVDEVATLYVREYGHGAKPGPITEWLRRCAILPWEYCAVAVENGRVLGFVIAAAIGPGPTATAGELEELYVVHGARGRGVGRALAEDAISWLRLCERTRPIRALVGHEAAEAAKAILSRLGFEQHAQAWGSWVR